MHSHLCPCVQHRFAAGFRELDKVVESVGHRPGRRQCHPRLFYSKDFSYEKMFVFDRIYKQLI